jgi:CheY-like chemotaxis protein
MTDGIPGGRRRALVVDDVPTTSATLRRLLEREGFEVEVTRTIAGAISLLGQHGHYDVAIVDLLLPDSPDDVSEEKRALATLEALRQPLASVSDVRIYTGVSGAALASFVASIGFAFYEKGGALPVSRDPLLAELEAMRSRLDSLSRSIEERDTGNARYLDALADAMCAKLLQRLAVADWSEIRHALAQSKQMRSAAAFVAKLMVTTFIVAIASAIISLLANGFRLWTRGS